MTSCTTATNGCEWASDIKASHEDVLTKGTSDQIKQHNALYEKFCG
jgi:hypothetical protein